MLANWNEFLRTHKNVEKAIKEVLEENNRLKAKIERLRKNEA
jgi:regulator of replication initiation timing